MVRWLRLAAGRRVSVDQEHSQTVRREFAKQAQGLSDPGYGFADPRLLSWMLRHIPPPPGGLVLDVAGGTGQVARAYAESAAAAVVADITAEMLAVGRQECADQAKDNVLFVEADATSLPFVDQSFDLVISRFAIHHFQQPRVAIAEMARVCRSGGRIGILDLVTADPALTASVDELELRRDPSHTHALPASVLADLVGEAGLAITQQVEHDQPVLVERWLSQGQTPAEVAQPIRKELHAEIEGGAPTGLRPHVRDGELYLTQRWAIVAATNPATRELHDDVDLSRR
jgi:SAM-dependent methyltransferase